MKKQIIITRILEFGGSNTYLKTLIRYHGKDNVFLVLVKKEERKLLDRVAALNEDAVVYFPAFKEKIEFKQNAWVSNLREGTSLLKSLFKIFRLSAKNSFAPVSISVIDPEKYLYLLWLPFIRVTYILHTLPHVTNNLFTTATCNIRLGSRKKIITVSDSNRESIVTRWRINKKKEGHVHVIYNCLGGGNGEVAKPILLAGEQNVVTMGHVAGYKNPQLWLQVAEKITQQCPTVYFYWLGNGEFLEEFKERTKDKKQINFVGLITQPEAYLANASIYYQPSLMESHGIAVVEAMSHQLPCVVSNVGGLRESVEHNKNGFVVDPWNVTENVERLLQLLDNYKLRRSMGSYSLDRYHKMFTYDSFKQNMDNINA